jgi:hypothetical protein
MSDDEHQLIMVQSPRTSPRGGGFRATARALSALVGVNSERREQRAVPRRRVFGSARIVLGTEFVAECVMRDISRAGARLQVATSAGIPDRFDLILLSGEDRLSCTVAWRTAHSVGVRF